MAELITSVGIGQIIIILLIAIPAIVNFISWCKKTWKEREDFKQTNIEKGKQMERRAEEKEERFHNGEVRIGQLEKDVADLKTMIANQEKLIQLLIKSDELDIKSWIKMQHEKWIPRKCIDSQTLDLLEQRFAIYEAEGGNSWAKKLVDELRALPIVTVVAIEDIHEER